MSDELKELRKASMEKSMAVPFDAVNGLLEKVATFIAELPQEDPAVRTRIAEFVDGDIDGWLVAFQLDSQIATTMFERIWSRKE